MGIICRTEERLIYGSNFEQLRHLGIVGLELRKRPEREYFGVVSVISATRQAIDCSNSPSSLNCMQGTVRPTLNRSEVVVQITHELSAGAYLGLGFLVSLAFGRR